MSSEVVVTLVDVIASIDEILESLSSIKKVVSNTDSTETLVIGMSNINAQLIDTNIHLANIETILQLLLEFAILIVAFKISYFICDKVFFNGV